MELRRLLELSPAIILPIVLGTCLICGVAGFFVIATTPEGLDPIEGMGLRVYLLRYDSELNHPAGTNPELARFEIEAGESATDVGVKLASRGLITDGVLFARYARFEGRDDDLRPGIFFVSQTMTIPEILNVLTDPTPNTVPFLIRENMRIEEIAAQIDNTPLLGFSGEEFLALVRAGAPIPQDFQQKYGIPEGASLEGFMYPATYDLDISATAEDFRDILLASFERSVPDTLISEAQRRGRTIYEVLTLASIVERETVLEEERAIIASVYWNRITRGMTLDADPTVQYQVANNRRDGVWWPPITQQDYRTAEGPYNTYLNTGLPPGPIVSPGVRSIRAAAQPAETTYLFFQLSCEGGGKHEFFDNRTDHEAYFQLRLNGCQAQPTSQ
ncbi:MAG: endolytic transglycosylase MltG [Chloroflexi bacterium]|nr:endolytic transglycosylase MltG [Chloroflexota bacterium]